MKSTKLQIFLFLTGDPYDKGEKTPTDLLDRLKTVKVTSHDAEEDPISSTRLLPQDREIPKLSTYGFQEPKIIPEGKCSLKQVLEFITKYQNNPDSHSVESIAETYKLKQDDVENILSNFRVFQLHVAHDEKREVPQSLMDTLGVKKIIRPMFHKKFAHVPKVTIPDLPEAKAREEK